MRIIDFFKSLFRKKSTEKSSGMMPWKRARGIWKIRSDYTMENSELIFAAVSRIANALSAMPLRLYKNSKPVNNELSNLVCIAPCFTPTCQWIKTLEACRGTTGNAYAMKVFDSAFQLVRIEPVDPSRVTPLIEETTQERWYKVLLRDGKEIYLHNYYMIHIPFISANGYVGINPVSVLTGTLGYSEEMQTFSRMQLDKGINAQIVVEAPANLGDAQRKQTIAAMQETWKASNGNVLLLESGLAAKTLNLSPVDTKVFEVEKITRSKVAMVYNIPPHLLGDYSDASFSSQEQQMIEFLTLTMLPIVTAYEQELNYKLLTTAQINEGFHFHFEVDSILRADSNTRADVYQKAIRGGWLKPNEVRAEYGRTPDPSGNKLLVARDLTTLEALIKDPTLNSGNKPAETRPAPLAEPKEGGKNDE